MDPLLILIFILVFLLVSIVLLGTLVWYIRLRFFRIGRAFALSIVEHVLGHVRHLPDAQKILEYDKVLDRILSEMGYTGTLGEKMKAYGKNFKNENAIWQAHKHRNKLAHEMGYSLQPHEVDGVVRAYEHEIESILRTRIQKK